MRAVRQTRPCVPSLSSEQPPCPPPPSASLLRQPSPPAISPMQTRILRREYTSAAHPEHMSDVVVASRTLQARKENDIGELLFMATLLHAQLTSSATSTSIRRPSARRRRRSPRILCATRRRCRRHVIRCHRDHHEAEHSKGRDIAKGGERPETSSSARRGKPEFAPTRRTPSAGLRIIFARRQYPHGPTRTPAFAIRATARAGQDPAATIASAAALAHASLPSPSATTALSARHRAVGGAEYVAARFVAVFHPGELIGFHVARANSLRSTARAAAPRVVVLRRHIRGHCTGLFEESAEPPQGVP